MSLVADEYKTLLGESEMVDGSGDDNSVDGNNDDNIVDGGNGDDGGEGLKSKSRSLLSFGLRKYASISEPVRSKKLSKMDF